VDDGAKYLEDLGFTWRTLSLRARSARRKGEEKAIGLREQVGDVSWRCDVHWTSMNWSVNSLVCGYPALPEGALALFSRKVYS